MPYQTSRFSFLVILLLFFASITAFSAPVLKYKLSFPQPQTHYIEVEMELKDFKEKTIDLKMPVWIPGSYMLREFAKNVESVSATANGAKIPVQKINKNTWRLQTDKKKAIRVLYKVYAFELTVRNSFVDESHAFINGTSVFMYPAEYKNLPATVSIQPYPEWKVISTSLVPAGNDQWQLKSANYDELADSPIEIGNHKVLKFTANAIPHEVAMFGESNYQEEKIVADLKKICEESAKVFGENPVKGKYVFIIHNTGGGGGGLEHANSTTLGVSRTGYAPERNYQGFLSLAAHEYFHLWNVKRLRPQPLGPFNYDAENYTSLLWVSEGFTSYYDDLLVNRAGFMTADRYLEVITGSINSVENTPGNKIQTVSESSFDAWIKFYRRTENSSNSEVSYYTKGGVLGMLLDLEIMHQTKGNKNLDNVMQAMYEKYYKKLNRGFTEKEIKEELEKIAGIKLDDFFANFINGTASPDYNKYFNYAGLKITNTNQNSSEGFLGASTSVQTNKVTVTSVVRDGAAWNAGLNVNDEIIAVNGMRITDDLNKAITGLPAGEKLNFIISRDGRLMSLDVELQANKNYRYKIEKLPEVSKVQQKVLNRWLRLN